MPVLLRRVKRPPFPFDFTPGLVCSRVIAPVSSKGRTRDFESLNRGSIPRAGTLVAMKRKYVGSTLSSLFEELGEREEVELLTQKKLLAAKIERAMTGKR